MSGSAPPQRRTGPFDRKLEHVLASAAQVIAREGFGRATIRQVAGAAGLSLAGLYHYVASKDELLFLIQFHTFDSIVRELERKLVPVRNPRERLGVVVANHFDHFLANMNALKVCVHEMESLDGEYYRKVQELRRAYFRTTLEIVEAIGREAGGSQIEPRLATLYLFGMLNWIYMWYPAVRSASGDALAAQLLTLFLDGYVPREAAGGRTGEGGIADV
jgi:AcrR family transcriptional regulator